MLGELDELMRRFPGLRRVAREGDVPWISEILRAMPEGEDGVTLLVFGATGGEIGGLLADTPGMRMAEALAIVYLSSGEAFPAGFRFRDAAEEESARRHAEGMEALWALIRDRHPDWSTLALAVGQEMLIQALRLRWEEDPS